MQREYQEILLELLDAIESYLGTGGTGKVEKADALPRIRSISARAPPVLKRMRPSIKWKLLSQVRAPAPSGGGAQQAASLLGAAKAAILDEFHLTSGSLVHFGRTDMSLAAIFDSELQGGPARCLFLDGCLSSAERPDGSPALFYQPIVERAFTLLKNPKRGLVIGIAGGTLIEQLKRSFPDVRIDGVDIDAGVFAMGKQFFSLKEDGRTSLHAADGRTFVRGTAASNGERYDIIIVDAFRGLSPVPEMVTQEFAKEAKASLKKGGICVINTIACVERGGYLQYVFNTWRSVFRNVLVLPLCNEGEVFNVVLVATDGDCRRFSAENSGGLYAMEFDQSRIFTDRDNPVSQYSPY